jgi:hypothetical protein
MPNVFRKALVRRTFAALSSTSGLRAVPHCAVAGPACYHPPACPGQPPGPLAIPPASTNHPQAAERVGTCARASGEATAASTNYAGAARLAQLKGWASW